MPRGSSRGADIFERLKGNINIMYETKTFRKRVWSESFHSLVKVIWGWSAWEVYSQGVSTMKGLVSEWADSEAHTCSAISYLVIVCGSGNLDVVQYVTSQKLESINQNGLAVAHPPVSWWSQMWLWVSQPQIKQERLALTWFVVHSVLYI